MASGTTRLLIPEEGIHSELGVETEANFKASHHNQTKTLSDCAAQSGNRYVQISNQFSTTPPPPPPINNTLWDELGLQQVNSNQMPLAGRLKYFAKNWELVTNDPWVLSAISGYQICFTEHPYQNTQPIMTFSVDDQELINRELEDLI